MNISKVTLHLVGISSGPVYSNAVVRFIPMDTIKYVIIKNTLYIDTPNGVGFFFTCGIENIHYWLSKMAKYVEKY